MRRQVKGSNLKAIWKERLEKLEKLIKEIVRETATSPTLYMSPLTKAPGWQIPQPTAALFRAGSRRMAHTDV